MVGAAELQTSWARGQTRHCDAAAQTPLCRCYGSGYFMLIVHERGADETRDAEYTSAAGVIGPEFTIEVARNWSTLPTLKPQCE